MVVKEQIQNMQKGQEIWYKNMYCFPEKLIVDKISIIDNKDVIFLSDGTYITGYSLEDVFLTENECNLACQKELKDKIEKLKLMLETSK